MALVMFIFISEVGDFPITPNLWHLGERGGRVFPSFFSPLAQPVLLTIRVAKSLCSCDQLLVVSNNGEGFNSGATHTPFSFSRELLLENYREREREESKGMGAAENISTKGVIPKPTQSQDLQCPY